jgi:hypothetical protein
MLKEESSWPKDTKATVQKRLSSLSFDNLVKINKKFLLGLEANGFKDKKDFFLIYNLALFKNDELCLTFSKNESYINDEFILEISRLDDVDQINIQKVIAVSLFLYLNMNIDEEIRPIYPEGFLKAIDTEQAIMAYAHKNSRNYDYGKLIQSKSKDERQREMCKFTKDILTSIDSIDTAVQYSIINGYLINNAITKYSK